jgi:hypothetical protein
MRLSSSQTPVWNWGYTSEHTIPDPRLIVKTRIFARIGIVLLGAALALWLARLYFLHPPHQVPYNHESSTYSGRLIEFRDLLAAGYLSPQWCTHFRGGLGAPYFSYYQPGFFYAASLVPWSVHPMRALGITVAAFALFGYLAMYGLVRARFGRLAGCLAGSALLLSVYSGTEISIRGDLSEFSAMMTLPAALWALAGWVEFARLRYLVCLAIVGAALVVLHPPVALVSYGLLAMALAVAALSLSRDNPTTKWYAGRPSVLAAVAALCVSVGLAAFYWVPLISEWDLVTTDAAFEGFYHYTNHFVDPLALLGPYTRQTTVPLTLGPVMVVLIGVNALILARRPDRATQWQRRCLVFTLVAMAVFIWLMSAGSASVWAFITSLQRLQFPWRILSVVTVLAAAASGSMLPWRREKLRAAFVVAVVLVMWAFSWKYTEYRIQPDVQIFTTVEELVAVDFAPDLRNEWLPSTAQTDVPKPLRRAPQTGPGCRVANFIRSQGRLSCRVETKEESHILLPHYFFPIGWKATVDGRRVSLRADDRGLMRIDLPAATKGRLEVQFSTTTMRKAGWAVSAVVLLIGQVAMVAAAWKRHFRLPGLAASRTDGLRGFELVGACSAEASS